MEKEKQPIADKNENDDIFIRRRYTFLIQNNLGSAVIKALRGNFKVSVAQGDEEIIIVEEKRS